MKPMGLIDLCLILILASTSKGDGWHINVDKDVKATPGSDVIIRCNFSFPKTNNGENVTVYWKRLKGTILKDEQQTDFVYNPDSSNVLERYRNKTSLTGNPAEGSCSLKIQNVTENDQNLYVRLDLKEITKKQRYSFYKELVTISLTDNQANASTPDSSPPSEETQQSEKSAHMYLSIFIPLAALLILVAGILIWMKHKRKHTFTREESGYYANFSRAPSNQAKREVLCKKQDNKKLPEQKAIDEPVYLKAIDDPVYVNMENPPGQMAQNMHDADNIYANVDYSKQ